MKTAEDYLRFLESGFWKELTRRKKALVGKCERCGSRQRLQSHHRFYRADWYDTRLEDLEVLCRWCHEKEHGIEEAPRAVALSAEGRDFKDMVELLAARSAGDISRRTFDDWKERLLGPRPERRRKKRARKVKFRMGQKRQGNPSGFRTKPIKRWVSRGTSSN